MDILTEFNVHTFLTEYWHKKPVLIKKHITNFVDPIDMNDLAGFAMEEVVESRIVRFHEDQWDNFTGPFDDFSDYTKGLWTLLVHGVEYLNEGASALMEQFNFIPYWRMNDLMVSYSVAGAGVGAHIDQYDVFLIQGKGRRRWQVAQRNRYGAELETTPGLIQVSDFIPELDVVCEPGDVLYIPPRFPHKGESLSDAMTYSVGYRAMDQVELFQGFAQHLSEHKSVPRRYTDTKRNAAIEPCAIADEDLGRLRQLLHELLFSENANDTLTQFLSERMQAFDEYIVTEGQAVDTNELMMMINQGVTLRRAPGLKPVYQELQLHEDFVFYIFGQKFSVLFDDRRTFAALLNNQRMQISYSDNLSYGSIIVLAELISQGYWHIEG